MSDTAIRRDAPQGAATNAALGHFDTAFKAQTSAGLTELRQHGFDLFAAHGLPSIREEAWKYTDARAIGKANFALASSLHSANLDDSQLDIDAYRLVFVDGVFDAERSSLDGLPEGVTLSPLSQRDELPQQFGSQLAANAGPFTALNQAFAGEGVYLDVARNVELNKPVYVLFASTAGDQQWMSHPRVLVSLADNASATLVEHFVGEEGAANFTNLVTEGTLARGARFDHYKLNEASDQDLHVANLKVEQLGDSLFKQHNLTLGGSLVRNDIDTELNGEGAQTEYHGLFFVKGRGHVDNHTVVNHNVARTFSNENYKGILNDRARGVFNGRVYIKQDAQQVRGYQNNANLLLSDRAEVDTKPELEIYADDVLCSHGASTGQLDEDAVFSLRARGIADEHARALLTLAFAGEVLESTAIAAVAQRVERRVAGMLPDRFDLEGLVDISA
ncbi:FeS cluster assembly protein SufD [Carnimonas sp. R-84981]|uniref:Fe-S cluster assembly protein SufD n=1 Tax=Carnimonas bestiolae TaxID=3402172 RepID=UPI003EDC853E